MGVWSLLLRVAQNEDVLLVASEWNPKLWEWTGFCGFPYGCGSKNRYQNGTLLSGNMDQNPRNPSCLILSHTLIGNHKETIRNLSNRQVGCRTSKPGGPCKGAEEARGRLATCSPKTSRNTPGGLLGPGTHALGRPKEPPSSGVAFPVFCLKP